ncbi:MAG: Lipase-like protein [Myxococcales bacterium]|nr:Lipase-like protein [Myxococcales bacterium]
MMRTWLSRAGLAAALWCGACGESGPEALMTADGDARTTPWPSDALLGADGKVKVALPLPFDSSVVENLTQLAATISESDGFSTTRSIFFPVVDDLVVADGAVAKVVDLEDGSKSWSYPLYYRAETKQLVAIAPLGTALAERHAYGCWIEAGVHDAAGKSLRPSATMRDAMNGRGDLGKRASYQKLAKAIEAAHVSPIAATAFTTQTVTAWAQKAIGDLNATAPKAVFTRLFSTAPELQALFGGPVTTTKPGRPPSGGVRHDSVAAVVEGTFDSPNYLSATPETLGLFDSGPSVKSTDHIPFILVLPIRANYAATPIVIFQHGINGDRSAVLTVANSYAARGYATLGIDELWHGSRLPGNVDEKMNLSGDPGSDGIGDPTAAGAVQYFFDFAGDSNNGVLAVDPRYIRDNFRQASVDLMQTVRMAKGGDWSDVVTQSSAAMPELAALTLDGTKLVYTGESFGSILGAIVLAVDPLLQAAVLDVGGGGMLVDLVTNSPQFAQLLQPFVAGAFDTLVDVNHPVETPAAGQMSLNFLQQVIEPGDGVALAAMADPTKNVLFLFAYADETVPNQSNQALARAWGATEVTLPGKTHPLEYVQLPALMAPVMTTPLRAVVQLDNASHGMFTSQSGRHEFKPPFPPFVRYDKPIPIDTPIEVAHKLALDFIDGFRAGAPVVSNN